MCRREIRFGQPQRRVIKRIPGEKRWRYLYFLIFFGSSKFSQALTLWLLAWRNKCGHESEFFMNIWWISHPRPLSEFRNVLINWIPGLRIGMKGRSALEDINHLLKWKVSVLTEPRWIDEVWPGHYSMCVEEHVAKSGSSAQENTHVIKEPELIISIILSCGTLYSIELRLDPPWKYQF